MSIIYTILFIQLFRSVSTSQCIQSRPGCAVCKEFWSTFPFSKYCEETVTDVSFLYSDLENTNVPIDSDSFCLSSTRSVIAIIIHGWQECGRSIWVQRMRDNLIAANPFIGVVVADYHRAAAFANPMMTFGNFRGVAKNIVFNLIKDYLIEKCGYDISTQLVCIGFSMGGQTCGFVGKYSQVYLKQTMFSLIAAEPASMFITCAKFPPSERISSTDANSVKIVHCGSVVGLCGSIGTADYYINTATNHQPGCFGLAPGKSIFSQIFQIISPTNIISSYVHTVACSHMYCAYTLADSFIHPLIATNCENRQEYIYLGNDTIYNALQGVYTINNQLVYPEWENQNFECPPTETKLRVSYLGILLGRYCDPRI